jgi:hypothetical protein
MMACFRHKCGAAEHWFSYFKSFYATFSELGLFDFSFESAQCFLSALHAFLSEKYFTNEICACVYASH